MFKRTRKLKAKITQLEKDNKILKEKNDSLEERNKRLEQIDKRIIDGIDEITGKKWDSFTTGCAGTLTLSSDFDNYKDRSEEFIIATNEDLKKLNEQMKATDKVFFLADKIEKLLEKLNNNPN